MFKRLCDIEQNLRGARHYRHPQQARIWKISINGTADTATRRYRFDHNEARIGWGETGDLTSQDIEQSAEFATSLWAQ